MTWWIVSLFAASPRHDIALCTQLHGEVVGSAGASGGGAVYMLVQVHRSGIVSVNHITYMVVYMYL